MDLDKIPRWFLELEPEEISHYIATFDEMLKDYLSGKFKSTEEIENRYLEYLNSGVQII